MDWKEALSAARGNFEEDNSVVENYNDQSLKENSQTNILSVVTDKKGRNGKIATIIEGFTIPQKEVEDLARKLKQKLGVGGSVRLGEILIQGDHKEKVKNFLSSLHFKVK